MMLCGYRILSAVYQRFTSLPKPQRYGSHWADVGFQGNDPATDLRSCGVLGLVQLLHLWDHHPGNAAVIYNMSRDAVHEFPLAVVAMNVTKWCLQVGHRGHGSAIVQTGAPRSWVYAMCVLSGAEPVADERHAFPIVFWSRVCAQGASQQRQTELGA